DARLEPAGDVEDQPAPAARLRQLAEEPRRRLRVGHVRHPDGGRADRVGAFEPFRHDADDGEGGAVQRDRATDDGRIAAEALLPFAVAEHADQLLSRRLVFVRQEATADLRTRAEDREEVAGDDLPEDLFRLAAAAG